MYQSSPFIRAAVRKDYQISTDFFLSQTKGWFLLKTRGQSLQVFIPKDGRIMDAFRSVEYLIKFEYFKPKIWQYFWWFLVGTHLKQGRNKCKQSFFLLFDLKEKEKESWPIHISLYLKFMWNRFSRSGEMLVLTNISWIIHVEFCQIPILIEKQIA